MHNLHAISFYDNIKIGKKKIQGRFVIPSGIRCTHASTISRYFEIAAVGIITTKSISIEAKKGYREPIFTKYGENSYINAVGLENPGATVFREELSKITVPDNKFLLVSIFGGDVESFYETAQELAPYADGFELNMSCPHSDGYGLQIGHDIDLVSRITKKIATVFDVPLFVKLSATIPNVARIAAAAIQNGAKGITITNTIGPSVDYVSEIPILSNVVGGMSGEAIRPLGLKALYDIRATIGKDPYVIGLGGIFNKEHVESYNMAGADFFGVGSALTNLTTPETSNFFFNLQRDIIKQRAVHTYTLPPVTNMQYRKCFVEENTALSDNLHKIKVSKWVAYDSALDVSGKFFFIMLPEIGEKPFSVFSYSDRDFIVKSVGPFTRELISLDAGDMLFIRGPYGNSIPEYSGVTINFVAGGTGIASVFEIAKKYSRSNKLRFFFGGKSCQDIFDVERFEKYGDVFISTDDGSKGSQGVVTDLLDSSLFDGKDRQIFINVGPKPMIENAYGIEKGLVSDDDIWVAIEYQTSCGVGICGKCATENGVISCVDGPFLRVKDAMKIEACEHQ